MDRKLPIIMFDKHDFAKRLKRKRKAAGFRSRESFAERYDEVFNLETDKSFLSTLKDYEMGKTAPSVENLFRICYLLNCDQGFLLGLYNESTKDIHEIATATGLSEEAISVIQRLSRECRYITPSEIIETKQFESILKQFQHLVYEINMLSCLMEDIKKYPDTKWRELSMAEQHTKIVELTDTVHELRLEKFLFADLCQDILNGKEHFTDILVQAEDTASDLERKSKLREYKEAEKKHFPNRFRT